MATYTIRTIPPELGKHLWGATAENEDTGSFAQVLAQYVTEREAAERALRDLLDEQALREATLNPEPFRTLRPSRAWEPVRPKDKQP